MAIVKVVKYDGPPNVFAWKHPDTQLGTWTQLIVNESQEAILFKGGQALDWFGPGTHTLETKNIPLLNKIINIPFGGQSPFSAEVWYVNKVTTLDVKWGTPTPIQIQDPKYNVFLPVRAHGQFGIRIKDARKFLTSLVGTLPAFTSNELIKYFRGAYLTKAKDSISEYLVKEKISALEINAYISEISDTLKENILPEFDNYGIELINFYVNDISVPEDDSAVIKLKDALAKKAEMDIIGYSYQQERSFDTLESAAKNPGPAQSSLLGAGLGLGMGLGVGRNFGRAFGDISKNLIVNETQKCPYCNGEIGAEYKFCPLCGKNLKADEDFIICPSCNTKNIKKAKFCSNCGYGFVKFCPKCKKQISDNQKFCIHCGAALIKKCQQCGHELDENTKFCPQCGNKVDGGNND